MSGLDELTGESFGPFAVDVSSDAAEEFTAAIGSDPTRLGGIAPPMFANVALFTAAPAFLEDARVVPYTRSLIHSEQAYEWARPLEIGETLEVVGTVEAVRVRGALNLVTFSTAASSDRGDWLTGSSVFLMSDQAAAGAEDQPEPGESDRPVFDVDAAPLPVPEIGGGLVDVRCGASRADLVRYAAASRDRNPIHFDHDAARAAGLSGTIVHGLLMGAWMARSAERYGSLRSLRLRFRSPLRPAVGAVVTGTVGELSDSEAALDLVLSAAGERLVTGRATVTP